MGRYITFLFLFCFCISGNAYTQTLIDALIAVVNTDAITRSELENEFRIAAIMESLLLRHRLLLRNALSLRQLSTVNRFTGIRTDWRCGCRARRAD